MTSLIDNMLDEHRQIYGLLDQLRAEGLSSEAGRRTLARVRQLVVAHLAHEDHQLYPAMRRTGATAALATEYASEMERISAELLGFFDGHGQPGGSLDQARAFGRAISQLRQRMTREEIRLYPAYRQHCEPSLA
ncbi:hemerythrin domain-containing protein [Cupriavidus respiraculi]|uniref:Hemerythrin-like domain-containing protein n=1 Tax=Cupriavidus respiraculi TaxID=195930 RepID=A0ABM8WLI4_9BURK|nr:hemerythrin domain-containing protein [Cupriavidus respiraculi]MBY4947524.1 hemerythrin domain-containing protein [Cupriavidus respiraculi]CAG9168239.1 hypothetical protein LMG21510_01006 [Cupriavidus respiraculi]